MNQETFINPDDPCGCLPENVSHVYEILQKLSREQTKEMLDCSEFLIDNESNEDIIMAECRLDGLSPFAKTKKSGKYVCLICATEWYEG